VGPAIEGAKIMGKRGVHSKIELRIHAVRAGDAVRAGNDTDELGRVVPEEELEPRRDGYEALGSSEKSGK
jgi:hypothetical protein